MDAVWVIAIMEELELAYRVLDVIKGVCGPLSHRRLKHIYCMMYRDFSAKQA